MNLFMIRQCDYACKKKKKVEIWLFNDANTLCKAVHLQQNDTCPMVIPQICPWCRQVTGEYILYVFYHTVDCSERNNNGKLFSVTESTTVYIWFPWNSSAWNAATDQRYKNKWPSVDHPCQNASEKHIPSVDPIFSLWRTWSRMYQASSHTNRSIHCFWSDAQRTLE